MQHIKDHIDLRLKCGKRRDVWFSFEERGAGCNGESGADASRQVSAVCAFIRFSFFIRSPVTGRSAKWAPVWADFSSHPASGNVRLAAKTGIRTCAAMHLGHTYRHSITWNRKLAVEQCSNPLAHTLCTSLRIASLFSCALGRRLVFLSRNKGRFMWLKKSYFTIKLSHSKAAVKNVFGIMDGETLLATESPSQFTPNVVQQSIFLC